MYIENYWGNYIGDTDDSLTLLEYLAGKDKAEISLGEILADTGLDKLDGNFKDADSLEMAIGEFEAEIYFAIDLITDLAALLLECKVNGSVKMCELSEEFEPDASLLITATDEEHELIHRALEDFVAEPLSYNLSEMMDEEEMLEMAEICEELRKELYEGN